MLKVLMIISEAPPIVSGVSRTAGNLTSGLAELGYHVDTLSVNEIPRLIKGEVRLSSMLWKAPRVFGGSLGAYDVVHIHGPVPTFSDVALLLSGLRRKGGGPVVVYTHHNEIDLPKVGPFCAAYNWSHKQLAKLADQVIVGTPTYANDLRHYVPAERVAVVPFSVDSHWYDERIPKAERFTVLFVGQLRPYKGVETLIDAASRVPDVDVHIVGRGYQEQLYRDLVAQRQIDNVTFRGRLSDAELFDAFAKAHVVVLPSTTRAEAFGLVLLEGMVAGCVPVASELPGVTDVVGDAGLCYPAGSADALAAVIAKVRDDVELWQVLSKRAQARAPHYSRQRMVFSHHALYQRAVAMRRFHGLLRTQDQDTALHALVRDTVRTLRASAGSIMLIDPEGQTLTLRASSGLPADLKHGARQPMGEGIAGFVAQRNVPLRLPESLAGGVVDELGPRCTRPHIRSSVSVPVGSSSQVFGVMNVSSFVDNRAFGDDDLRFLTSLARQVAPSVASGRDGPLVAHLRWDPK